MFKMFRMLKEQLKAVKIQIQKKMLYFCVITTNVTIKVQEEDSKIIFYQNIKVSCILVASVTIKLLVKLS